MGRGDAASAASQQELAITMNDPALEGRISELISGFLAQGKDHAIVVMDSHGLVIAWLGGAEHVLGYATQEVTGRPISQIFTKEDQAKGLHLYELEVARTSSRSEDERWHVRKDGTHVWVTGTVTAVRNAADEVIGFVKIMRDRTDLRTQIETLENRLAGVLHKHEDIALFLSTLGHELRNPLGPIGTAAHIIERQSTGASLSTPLGIVRRQLAVLERLANDLMDMSRLSVGRLELRRSTLELQALLRDSVTGLEERARAKGLVLQAVLPDAPIRVEADPDRLQQVVLNLIDNALKYTPSGGQVWVKAIEEGTDAIIRVEDTGVGIAPELLPRIFELFTQGSRSIPATSMGLGIGLGLARDIVALHGGNIEVRSGGIGKGAEFTVRLPLKASEQSDLLLP
jgi:PAS domain S-box-containing protein